LDRIEHVWGQARDAAARAAGQVPLEHAHWDWRNKADDVAAGVFNLVAVAVQSDVQGVMAVKRLPRPAAIGGGQVVYVDYLEAAPWNLKGMTAPPRYVGVGTALMIEAIRISWEVGLGGRVGLHSLPQAEAFYPRCGMTRVGVDPGYYDLTYFEYTGQQATTWVAAVGETL
jgi:hypothetical protein